MKKLFTILAVLLALLVAGCGSPGQATQQSKEDKQVKVIQTALGCTDEIAKKSAETVDYGLSAVLDGSGHPDAAVEDCHVLEADACKQYAD